jgi:GT2 family glycosyltransferase
MMRNRNIKVSVCILTYNRATILRELLVSLDRISCEDIEVIVTDNHSVDGTEQMIRNEFSRIAYYRMPANQGVAGRNLGIRNATGDIIITLDDDVIGIGVHKIETLVRLFEAKTDVGAICFKVIDYESGDVCNWCHHYEKEKYSDREFVTDEITEGAVAFRKTALAKSGLYPTYFFISHEGPDLLCRLLDVGYNTIYSPEICVRHRTAQEGRKSWRRYYYDTRNQIWLAVRNYPVLWAIRYLLRGLTAMFFYSVRDGFCRYWIKGVVDGIMGIAKVAKDRKPISRSTRKVLTEISSHRPGWGYIIKERLLRRGVRL